MNEWLWHVMHRGRSLHSDLEHFPRMRSIGWWGKPFEFTAVSSASADEACTLHHYTFVEMILNTCESLARSVRGSSLDVH